MNTRRNERGLAGGEPPPVRSRNLVAQLTDHMRHRILSGAFEAGERLNIRSLSDGYGISVTPMREALAKLNAEGLVSFRENAGYRVKEAPTDAEYALWSEARIAIETRAIELAKPGLVAASLPDLLSRRVVGAELLELRFDRHVRVLLQGSVRRHAPGEDQVRCRLM